MPSPPCKIGGFALWKTFSINTIDKIDKVEYNGIITLNKDEYNG